MPGSVGYAAYEPKDTLTLPYYGLGLEAASSETESGARYYSCAGCRWVRSLFTEVIASMRPMARSDWCRAL